MTQAYFDFEDGSWTEVIEEDDAATYERELHEWMEAQKSDDLRAVEKERDEWKERAEKAEAERDEARASADSLAEDVVGQGIALTAEAEKWRAKHAALRADVEEHSGAGGLPILNEEARDILYRDAVREPKGQS